MALTLPKLTKSADKIVRTGGPGREAEPNPYTDVLTSLESTRDKGGTSDTMQMVLKAEDVKAHQNAIRRAAARLDTPVTVIFQVSEVNDKGQVAVRFETRDKISKGKPATADADAAASAA